MFKIHVQIVPTYLHTYTYEYKFVLLTPFKVIFMRSSRRLVICFICLPTTTYEGERIQMLSRLIQRCNSITAGLGLLEVIWVGLAKIHLGQ
jgi:hypothetical protein